MGHGNLYLLRTSMLDLNLLAIFARVAEAGSFAEAARRLNSSRSAISKAVAKLEVALGARLLNRTTRHLSLTEIGAAIAEHGSRILEEAADAENLVASLASEPRGTLRISSSVAFGTLHVAPALAEFLPQYPNIKVDLTISDRWVDLAEEGYDLLIQVTGHDNYLRCSLALFGDERLLRTPELLEQPQWAAESAAWFWSVNGLNALADQDQFNTITRRINGGLNGLEDRLQLWARARAVLCVSSI